VELLRTIPGVDRRSADQIVAEIGTDKAATDLGADYFLRRHDPSRHAAKLVRQLQAIGYSVTLEEVGAA
jgi:Holliday junction resolvasome RuvABC DNA-binding subunit